MGADSGPRLGRLCTVRFLIVGGDSHLRGNDPTCFGDAVRGLSLGPIRPPHRAGCNVCNQRGPQPGAGASGDAGERSDMAPGGAGPGQRFGEGGHDAGGTGPDTQPGASVSPVQRHRPQSGGDAWIAPIGPGGHRASAGDHRPRGRPLPVHRPLRNQSGPDPADPHGFHRDS